MIKVAVFNVDVGEQIVKMSDGRKNKEIIQTMIASVKKNIPQAKIYQLSDDTTDHVEGFDECIRFGSKPEFLMPARMEYQYKFIKNHCDKTDDVIFLDPDIIVQKDISELFALHGSWDVAFTWRNNLGELSKQMPFNAGVVLSRCTASAEYFWKIASDALKSAPDNVKKWYGDQLVMIKIVGYDNYAKRQLDIEVISTNMDNIPMDFLVLPCEQYNYSPAGDELMRSFNIGKGSTCYQRLETKHVLHFKGGLKDSMIKYWDMVKA